MIKFDRDVHLTLKNLEKAGFETYATGYCVRDVIRGVNTYDWDLVTKADLKQMQELFPDGKVIDADNQILRIDFTYEVTPKDEDESPYLEGAVVDIRHMEGTIEEELSEAGFTVNAMADNPERNFIDPYDGRSDMKKKLIRTINEPDALFKKEPVRMMEAVRLAAELDFDLQKNVHNAILANWRLLMDYNPDEIREELELLLTADHAGKGLNIMAGSGLMAVIVGEEVSRRMSATEMNSFTTLCENIDKTKPVRMRRLGLLYTCFSKKRGLQAIERMNFDEKTKLHLTDAMTDLISIQFLNDDKSFKRYLFEHGEERYNYLHNLNKAQRIIYDGPTNKIEARNYMMREIINNNEAVFVEDLVIDANDVMEAGITDSPEKAEELLNLVIAQVHQDPRNNDRAYLLKLAKKYSKSKLSAKTRYVKWLK